MKKSKKPKSSNRKVAGKAKTVQAEEPVNTGRRKTLRRLGNYAIGLGVLGGAGLFVARSVSSTIEEHDLSRINNGTPTIVQIHDPQCNMCLNLQRETRKAMRAFDRNQLDYVVANIRTAEGRSFQNNYGVPHVTLLLFDAGGELKSTLQGPRERDDLQRAFQRLVSG